jgi:hypothetical protein
MKMKINLIIGAGQLGSRHLQGLIKVTESQKIYVLDPSLESLEIAKQRANEINHSIEINYLTSWSSLPVAFDLVIVATSASVRSQIAKNLLGNYVVKNLILEKILFQDLQSYEDIKLLIKETKTPTWVNHPRRLTKHYGAIKKEIASTGEKVVFNVIGSNWGLACNALHFIDLCAFLTNSEVDQLDMDWLNTEIQESKRANNIEFTGTIKGLMKNKSVFTISSLAGTIGDISVIISTNTNRWIVQEGKSESIIHMTTNEGFKPAMTHFETEFQSSLTTEIVKSIFDKQVVLIPTYDEASASHIPFITAAIDKYNDLTTQNISTCPIT